MCRIWKLPINFVLFLKGLKSDLRDPLVLHHRKQCSYKVGTSYFLCKKKYNIEINYIFAFFQAAYSQVLNRLVSNVLPIGETILPNQVLLNSLGQNLVQVAPNVLPLGPNVLPLGPNVLPLGPNVLPVGPNVVNYDPYVDTVLSSPVTVPTTTIIQDSTVANNLANALQLLVVSNLLSNTLPSMGDVLVPSYSAPVELVSPLSLGGLGGYYIA